MKEGLTIGFIGNPNCGKTTLFNAYTGANLKVANWPGVTVEKKEGTLKYEAQVLKLVDLPGTYSLTSYTMEETVARQYILSGAVDVLINVVDASCLERNLYLTLQLIELGKPVVLALNMMDIVAKQGMEIDLHRLGEILGIPVVPVSARKKSGLDALMHTAAHYQDTPAQKQPGQHQPDEQTGQKGHPKYIITYEDWLENKIGQVVSSLQSVYPLMNNYRWHAIKLLEKDEAVLTAYPLSGNTLHHSYELDFINQKYNFIEKIIEEVLVNKAGVEAITDKVDGVLTNEWLGLPLFFAIMALVFFLTFFIGDWLKTYFEWGIEQLSDFIINIMAAGSVNPILTSLVADGIIAGVGGILTFLPNIFILFLALAFLEDSGYMARVAYVMDGIMGKLGLSGKAFIPMLLGFGCTVPAVMASRALESKRERFHVMLVTPFMSCSAKLPIYVLFSQVFFGKYAMAAAYSMYVLGVFLAILVAYAIHLLGGGKGTGKETLLIELPAYKAPSGRTVFIYVWEKVKDYLTRAGTTIFIASMVMWILLNFGAGGYTDRMQDSFGAVFGRWLVPVLSPIGLGFWQIAVALIAGLSAKEVVVSSCAVLFGIANLSSVDGMNALRGILHYEGFGPLNAYAMMVFCLLYVPCIAALGTVRRESGSWRWTGMTVVFQLGMAWVVTFFVYRVGLFIFYS